MGHVPGPRPLLGRGVEQDSVGATGDVAGVGQGAAGGEQPPVGEEAVAAAEEVEDLPVVALDGDGVKEVLVTVRRRDGRVPYHARVDLLVEAAEVGALLPLLDVAGPSEEHHLPGGQHGSVHRQHLGVERQILPRAGGGRVGVEVEHPVQARVLANWVVHEHGDQLALAVDLRDGDASAGVLRGEPAGQHGPRAPPVLDVTVHVQVLANLVEALVEAGRVVHLVDDDVPGTRPQVSDRHARRLVLPGEPVRHLLPFTPAAGHGAAGVELATDPVVALVPLWGVVHHEHDQLRPAVAVEVGHRHPAVLVLEREPVGYRLPAGPAARGRAVGRDALAYPVEPPVSPGRIVDHQYDEIARATATQVRYRHPGTLVVEREPIRDRYETVRHDPRLLLSGNVSDRAVHRWTLRTGACRWRPAGRRHPGRPA